MRHNYRLEGSLFRIRPVVDSDSDYIVVLRNNSRRGKFLNDGATSVQAQLAWLNSYYKKQDDYLFVIESIRGEQRQGLISLYDIDIEDRKAEWGRWILDEGSLAAVESVLLIFTFAFDVLLLQAVWCRTVAENAKVVSFHESLGLTRGEVLPGYISKNNVKLDAIEHWLSRDSWPLVKERLTILSEKLEKSVRRW